MGIDKFDVPAVIEQFQTGRPISQLMLLIWQSRKDLQKAFDLNTQAGQESFLNWYDITVNRLHGSSNFDANQTISLYSRLKRAESRLSRSSQWIPAVFRNRVKQIWFWLMAKAARVTSTPMRTQENTVQQSRRKLGQPEVILDEGVPGANLIGYARAELGMGEHVRMSAAAFSETEVPFGVVDFGAGTSSRQKASLNYGAVINTNKYKVNIFHVNADQILPVFVHLGRVFFEQRYNIGYPFWELSKFPLEWIPPMQLMDEVWAPTTFIQDALTQALGREVPLLPVCVVLPTIFKLGRSYFSIPANQYQFFFAFDSYSFIDRKNPYAVVAAFKMAFPFGNEKAGLIIKSMNAKESSESWKKLINETGGDKRIKIINETMEKSRLLSLMAECDCYISLHRSEGLGLGPMEAMLLGKPVIVTNYSGNTDYAKPDNSCLVDYSLISVKEGQYLFHENQVWADPDVKHAAWYMKKLAEEPEYGVSLGRKGAEFLSSNFSPANCGKLYKQRLQELGML